MAERESIRLLTLTRLWLFGRYLYGVGEFRLWTPISHRAIGYVVAVFLPVWVALHWLDAPFTASGLFVRFTIPGLLVWWALRTVAEGARPSELLTSWARLGWHATRGQRVQPVRVAQRTRAAMGAPTRIREH